MIVAYYIPHNDGVEAGILTKSGQSTGLTLVDLYEVDGEIRSFETLEEADAWIRGHSLDPNQPDPTEIFEEPTCAIHSATVRYDDERAPYVETLDVKEGLL